MDDVYVGVIKPEGPETIPEILAPGKERQKYQKLEGSLSYIVQGQLQLPETKKEIAGGWKEEPKRQRNKRTLLIQEPLNLCLKIALLNKCEELPFLLSLPGEGGLCPPPPQLVQTSMCLGTAA